jgi:hypothetical protein
MKAFILALIIVLTGGCVGQDNQSTDRSSLRELREELERMDRCPWYNENGHEVDGHQSVTVMRL